MILNFRHHAFILNIFFISLYALFIFAVKITISSTFFDTLTHIYVSDFYWNNFYYIWTQFFILPSLLLLIYYLFNITTLKCKNLIFIFKLSLWVLLLLWWVFDYYTLNNYCFFFKNTQYFFNNLLNNPLNKYHPILFFSSYIFIYNSSTYSNFFTNYRVFHINHHQNLLTYLQTCTKTGFYWILITFSLYLGSWWALQEGSWGGWWNWDASEVFGLLILTLLLTLFHLKNKSNFLILSAVVSYFFSLIILITYSLLQLSYTLVSHNFGLNLLGYGYVNITFIVLILLLVNTCLFVLLGLKLIIEWLPSTFVKQKKTQWLGHWSKFYQDALNPITTILLILTLLTFYIYLVSFNPIINNIFWTSFNIEVLNTLFYWFNFKLIVVLLLVLMVINYNALMLAVVVLSNAFSHYNTLAVLYGLKKNIQNKIIHIFILLTLLPPLLLENTLLTEWVNLCESGVNYCDSYARSPLRNNFFVENIYVIDSTVGLKAGDVVVPNSFYYFNTSLDTQFFELDLDSNLLRQVIYNHTYLYTFYVIIWDTPSLVTDATFTLLGVNILRLYFCKQKIVF